MEIIRIAHAAVRICTGQTVIYLDPFIVPKPINDADVIFISHEHYDHFSPEDIKKVSNKNTVLVAPAAVVRQAQAETWPLKETVLIQPDGTYCAGGISFTVIPAYNINKKFHPPQKGGVGYLLFLGGETVYFAGDTDATPELLQVKCTIALLPIGGTFTMDATEAAKAANTIKPRMVIPIHYGDISSTAGTQAADYFESLLDPSIECRII